MLDWLRAADAEIVYSHTSGHASPADLRAFAAAVRPEVVVSVHGAKWDEEGHDFGMVSHLVDGETMEITRRNWDIASDGRLRAPVAKRVCRD